MHNYDSYKLFNVKTTQNSYNIPGADQEGGEISLISHKYGQKWANNTLDPFIISWPAPAFVFLDYI